MTNLRYASWVPTVLGKLSFTVIEQGTTFGRGGCSYQNGKADYAVFGETVTSDHVSPRLQRATSSRNGVFNALFIASSDQEPGDIGHISGELFLCPSNQALRSNLSTADLQEFSDAADAIVSLRKGLLSIDEVNYQKKLDRIKILSVLSCSVELHRSGLVYIDLYDNNVALTNDGKNGSTRSLNLEVATVLYNTVRDIFHTHKHHHPKGDNIVSVRLLNSTKIDTRWAMEIQNSIVRKLIALHGDNDSQSQTEAQGISAYLHTFNSLFIDDIVLPTLTDGSLKMPFIGNFEASIRAKENNFSSKRANFTQHIFLMLTVIGVFLAVGQILIARELDTWMVYSSALLALLMASYIVFASRKIWIMKIGVLRHIKLLDSARIGLVVLIIALTSAIYLLAS